MSIVLDSGLPICCVKYPHGAWVLLRVRRVCFAGMYRLRFVSQHDFQALFASPAAKMFSFWILRSCSKLAPPFCTDRSFGWSEWSVYAVLMECGVFTMAQAIMFITSPGCLVCFDCP